MTHAEAGARGGVARASATTHEQRVAWGKLGAASGVLGGHPSTRFTISELRLQNETIIKEVKLPSSLRELKRAWRERMAAVA